MKKELIWPTILVVLCFGYHTIAFADENDTRVWIRYHSGQAENAKQVLNQVGAAMHYGFPKLNAYAVTLPAAAIQGLSKNPSIDLIEEDPKRYPFTQTVPYGIDKVGATAVWEASSQSNGLIDIVSGAPTGKGIKVCIIDSGLYSSHEDFSILTGFTGSITGSSNSGAGTWSTDNCGHGTHVAGTIAAANNDLGVVGVSPGTVSLHSVKVFGTDTAEGCGWAYSSSLVNAALQCPLDTRVISMSLGGSTKSVVEEYAFNDLYAKGKLSVAAAGNGGNTAYSYPASYSSIISVAAVDSANTVASFSQQNDQVDLAAPGVGVLSTVPWKSTNTVTVNGNTYTGNKIEYAASTSTEGISGGLVDGGFCGSSNASWTDKVVLCERGNNISFSTKVSNVQASNGKVAVIYNNVPGSFSGTLGAGNSSTIPAISLSREDGLALINLSDQATVVSTTIKPGNGYEAWDGTSMATPHVSGVAALVWSPDNTKSNNEIRSALQSKAIDLGALYRDNAYGYGLVQADDALLYLNNPNPLNISKFSTTKQSGGSFTITWTTNRAANSVVNFTNCCGSFSDNSLTTIHKMSLRGTRGATYKYYVSSTDANGITNTSVLYTLLNK